MNVILTLFSLSSVFLRLSEGVCQVENQRGKSDSFRDHVLANASENQECWQSAKKLTESLEIFD